MRTWSDRSELSHDHAALHKRELRAAKIVECKFCGAQLHTKKQRMRHSCDFCAEAGIKCMDCGRVIPNMTSSHLCKKCYQRNWSRGRRRNAGR